MNIQQPSYRTERISELIKRELILLFANKVVDERLKSIRILEVIVNKDLSSAKVFFDSETNQNQLKEPLKKAQGFLRYHIAKTVQLRHTPTLKFVYDDSSKNARRIDELLAKP